MKKKILAGALAVCMLATLVIGASLAYFTDTETATNTFTVGNVNITLDEAPVTKGEDSKWTADDKADRVQANTYNNVYPGAELPKDPRVTLAATSSDAFIRVKVTISSAADWQAACSAHKITNLADIFGGHVETLWARVGDGVVDTDADTITFTYNHNAKVSAGTTATLFTSVTIPSAFTSAEMAAFGEKFTMVITADAIQADGFDTVTEAFAQFVAPTA